MSSQLQWRTQAQTLMGRIWHFSRWLVMRRMAKAMVIRSSGGTSEYPECYRKSELGAE